jgi:hypothetical protein
MGASTRLERLAALEGVLLTMEGREFRLEDLRNRLAEAVGDELGDEAVMELGRVHSMYEIRPKEFERDEFEMIRRRHGGGDEVD